MNNKVIFSFIVPVYNTSSNYLDECIYSLINQTVKEIEIIIVDDGSTEEVARHCDIFEFDTRIHVLHVENCGASEARNIGIRNTKGEYIIFVDSDDWIDLDLCEKCISKLEENIDILIYSYVDEFVYDKICFDNSKVEDFILNDNDLANYQNGLVCQRYMNLSGVIGSPWGRVFRTSYIKKHSIYFPKNISTIEDKLFNLYLTKYIPVIKYINIPLYHYRHRENSLCRQTFDIDVYKNYVSEMKKTIFSIDNVKFNNCIFQEFAAELYVNNWKNVIVTSKIRDFSDMKKNIKKSMEYLYEEKLLVETVKLSKGFSIYCFMIRHYMFISIKILNKILKIIRKKQHVLFK